MKIDNSVKGTGAAASNGTTRQRAGVAPSNEAETASTQVKITSLSSLGIDSVLANAPVTNPDKIAEIKQAIADGRFTVNADKIASGLIDSVRQMLAKPGSDA
jgi:negative regulator of flagellin synthesis FlgM